MPHPSQPPDPTPEQIADECDRIRDEWSERERRKRAGIRHDVVETPTVRVPRVT